MRFLDILISFLLCVILVLPVLLVALVIKLTSRGDILYWSDRIGRNNIIFRMPKFRSMRVDTPEVATHLLDDKLYLTPVGSFLRRSSIDEIPQVFSVLVGDMALVGPRPALFNQDDLKELRTRFNIQRLRPGVTGWAQINGRDNLSIKEKVNYEIDYLKRKTIFFDIKILFLTLFKVIFGSNISH